MDGQNWAVFAKEAFCQVGLCFSGDIHGPFYRPHSNENKGSNCRRGVASSEITWFLRACFEKPGDDLTLGRGSSHSLKSTPLSYTAKACVGAPDQAILGRHSFAFNETSAIYSRDNSIRAVSLFQDVIHAIHAKEFLPDSERSRYYPRTEVAPGDSAESEAAVKLEEVERDDGVEVVELPLVIDLDTEEESSSSDSSTSSQGSMGSQTERQPKRPRVFRHEGLCAV